MRWEVNMSNRDVLLAGVLLAMVIALTVVALLGGWFNYNAAVGGAIGAGVGLLISRRPSRRSL